MQNFARAAAGRCRRRRRQSAGPAGVVADAVFRLLHAEQGGVVDLDPDHGARAGAAHPGERHRPRPDAAEPAADRRAVRPAMRTMPLRRGTSPEEIAAAMRFILAAPAMTGQMIALDGGAASRLGATRNGSCRSSRSAVHAGAAKCLDLSHGFGSDFGHGCESCSQRVLPMGDTRRYVTFCRLLPWLTIYSQKSEVISI